MDGRETTQRSRLALSHAVPSTRPKLAIVVVEAHQHALEHIHTVLRHRARRRCKNESIGDDDSIALVHFDSHPDLACPGRHVPAAACFTPRAEWPCRRNTVLPSNGNRGQEASSTGNDAPRLKGDVARHNRDDSLEESKNLYELLDSSRSGIAEWILPLVLAGGLRKIHWIKNVWCNQFGVGSYQYNVGAWLPPSLSRSANVMSLDEEAVVRQEGGADKSIQMFHDLPSEAIIKVDLEHPYYFDDGSVVPSKDLLLPQPVELVVWQIHDDEPSTCTPDARLCNEVSVAIRGGAERNYDTTHCSDCSPRTLRNDSTGKKRPRSPLPEKGLTTATPDEEKLLVKMSDGNPLDIIHGLARDLSPLHRYRGPGDSEGRREWILDICLDYFACSNPFLTDLEALDANFTNALVDLATEVRHRNVSAKTHTRNLVGPAYKTTLECEVEKDTHTSADASQKKNSGGSGAETCGAFYEEEARVFRRLMCALFEGVVKNATDIASATTSSRGWTAGLTKEDLNLLYNLYSPPSVGVDLVSRLGDALNGNPHAAKLATLTLDALPSINMPHEVNKDTALLSFVQKGLRHMEKALRDCQWEDETSPDHLDHTPMIVTIARSSEDGFTPSSIVGQLQRDVISTVHSIYCGCNEFRCASTDGVRSSQAFDPSGSGLPVNLPKCVCKVVYDYGEWEGASLEHVV